MVMICSLIAILIAGVDLGMKMGIEKHVNGKEEHSIWKKRGILRKVHNRGMMMNRLEQHPLLVQLASVFALGILMICQAVILKKPGHNKEKIGMAMMTGGAISNTWDRLRRGCVVDYLAVKTRHKKLTDITFNLGDLAIFAGVIIWVLGAIFHKDAQEK